MKNKTTTKGANLQPQEQKIPVSLSPAEAINQKLKEDLLSIVSSHAQYAIEAVCHTDGITAWFKAYIESKHFAKMEQGRRGNAFEIYDRLQLMLNQIDSLNIKYA
jgi:hypothetical protein